MNRTTDGSCPGRIFDERTAQDHQVVHISAGQPEIGFENSHKGGASDKA
jgi:hypothetical protein